MNVEIGVKSDPVEYRYSYEWLFQLMERMGVRYLQLGSSSEMYGLPDRYFIRLRDQAADRGVRIHSCFTAHRELGGMLSDDRDLQQVAKQNYRRYLEIGALLGAESVGSNAGSIPRDRMDTKQAAIQRYLSAMSEIAEYAGRVGLQALTLEPMSSLAEPPSTPEEITHFMERLAGGRLPVPVYLCSDITHGVADAAGVVVHSNMDLFEHAIPWMWEFHFKNTDARFESTFGFGAADMERGIVDLNAVAAMIDANANRFPRDHIVGYVEIPGPKLGRDYSDPLLGQQLSETISAVQRHFG